MKRSTFGLLVLLIVVIVSILFSCTEVARDNIAKSYKKPTDTLEKVVIIDSTPRVNTGYHYKVKRISKGVTTYIDKPDLYEKGDTVLHQFQ